MFILRRRISAAELHLQDYENAPIYIQKSRSNKSLKFIWVEILFDSDNYSNFLFTADLLHNHSDELLGLVDAVQSTIEHAHAIIPKKYYKTTMKIYRENQSD